jgi:hypothetical protein
MGKKKISKQIKNNMPKNAALQAGTALRLPLSDNEGEKGAMEACCMTFCRGEEATATARQATGQRQ